MNQTKAQQDSIELSQLISMPGWRLLVNEAKDEGGADNITVVVVKVEE